MPIIECNPGADQDHRPNWPTTYFCKQFYWNPPLTTYLCIIVCGCLPTTMAELSNCDRNHIVSKPKLFII